MIHMSTKFGENVSYYKAWRAKELVMNSLNGEAKESYAFDPILFYEAEKNEFVCVFILIIYILYINQAFNGMIYVKPVSKI